MRHIEALAAFTRYFQTVRRLEARPGAGRGAPPNNMCEVIARLRRSWKRFRPRPDNPSAHRSGMPSSVQCSSAPYTSDRKMVNSLAWRLSALDVTCVFIMLGDQWEHLISQGSCARKTKIFANGQKMICSGQRLTSPLYYSREQRFQLPLFPGSGGEDRYYHLSIRNRYRHFLSCPRRRSHSRRRGPPGEGVITAASPLQWIIRWL